MKESSVSVASEAEKSRLDRQERVPIIEALKRHRAEGVVPFHVPGHEHGRGNPAMVELFGSTMMELDLNAMADIDDLANPVSVIREAQELAAEAFGADNAYFLINGTSSGIHAMLLSALNQRDRIIVPRDGHKSMYAALILSGASPIFIPPSIHPEFGFTLPPDPEDIESIFAEVRQIHSLEIKAMFAINPSYCGLSPRLDLLAKIAHREELTLLVDEAHGAHFYFHPGFPQTAMASGASMSAVSMHKTGGSLTQSSLLLRKGDRISNENLRNILDLLRTSSSSYLLMSSLDSARSRLATRGRELLEETLILARNTRSQINSIPGLHCPGPEDFRKDHRVGGFDETRLTIGVQGLGLNGFQVERILRKEYSVQVEMSEFQSVVAVVTFGDTAETLGKLVAALQNLARNAEVSRKMERFPEHPPVPPRVMNPRDAFYSRKTSLPLAEITGSICGEMIMAYPPGIPLICPGEVITEDIVSHVQALKSAGAALQGMADPLADRIRIVEGS